MSGAIKNKNSPQFSASCLTNAAFISTFQYNNPDYFTRDGSYRQTFNKFFKPG
jgi:hypothetical protein